MATTTISDAVVVPQDNGTGLSSKDPNSAAAVAVLANHIEGSYVESGLSFTGHDGVNDTITVGSGVAFIVDDSTSTGGSRGSGGNAQIQSSSSTYDTELPLEQVYAVILPTAVTVDVSDTTLNQIWLNITDVTSDNAVEIRSDGGGGTTAAPSDTFLKLGEANPDDASQDIRTSFGPPGYWVEDPNSPFTPGSASAKQTFELGVGEAERIRVRFDMTMASGGASRVLNLTLNNNTNAIYGHRTGGGSGTRDDTHVPVIDAGGADNDPVVQIEMWAFENRNVSGVTSPYVRGRFANEISFSTEGPGLDGPLTQFETVEDSNNSITYNEVVVEVMVPR